MILMITAAVCIADRQLPEQSVPERKQPDA
jgi:hypothetical protein